MMIYFSSGITSPEIPMQLLVLSLVEVLPVSEFHQLISSNLQGERLRSANHAQFAEKKLENIKRCNQIQFVAVTDGFLISLVGVAHNLSDEIDRVKSGWLMRTINLMKIKQDFHTFDKSLLPSDGDQNLESSLSHWKAYPYFLIGTSSSVAFKPCPVVAPRLMLGQIHQIPIRRFSGLSLKVKVLFSIIFSSQLRYLEPISYLYSSICTRNRRTKVSIMRPILLSWRPFQIF